MAKGDSVLAGAPRFVLIVEDDEVVAGLLPAWLGALWGTATTTYLVVHSLAKAACVLAKETPNLVILDLRLPDSDGAETVQRMCDLLRPHPEVPIVAMSGYLGDTEGVDVMFAGCTSFVSKYGGLNPQAFRRTLSRAWARAQGAAWRYRQAQQSPAG